MWRWFSLTSCRSSCSPWSPPRFSTQSARYSQNKLNLFWSCYGVAKIKFSLFSFSLITLERSQCAIFRIRKLLFMKYWNQNQFITSTIFVKGKLKILMRFIDLFWMVPHIFNESKGREELKIKLNSSGYCNKGFYFICRTHNRI